MKVRTRIAPSPTGEPHVGTIYIALFNLIFARSYKGTFILRIEDTDARRSLSEYEEAIYAALKWCGITWQEGPDVGGRYGPYRQSERLSIYKKYVEKLLAEGKAYKCFATPQELDEMRKVAAKLGEKIGYDRRYRNLSQKECEEREKEGQSYVIRIKVPLKGECIFEDAIKGKISCPWEDVDDQIILKSDGYPTYHLANVVDDHLMEISHVIRGDEWLASMPKHILLYEYLGFEKPTFIHMPLLLGEDRKKLSKRKNPTPVFYYRDEGFLPEALVNFLTLMGYSMPEEKEIYSLKEITNSFDIKRIGKADAFFDIKKLKWLNQKYIINNLSERSLLSKLKEWQFNDDYFKKLMPLIHTRIKTFTEFMELCDFFFISHLNYTKEMFCPKEIGTEQACYLLQSIIWDLEEKKDWTSDSLEKTSHKVADLFHVDHKKIIMPLLFVALTGKKVGPPLFASFEILGINRTRARLLKAIEFLGALSNKALEKLKKCWDKGNCRDLL